MGPGVKILAFTRDFNFKGSRAKGRSIKATTNMNSKHKSIIDQLTRRLRHNYQIQGLSQLKSNKIIELILYPLQQVVLKNYFSAISDKI